MMNKRYLDNEIKTCKAKRRQLEKEFMMEDDISIMKSKLNEMLDLALMENDFKSMKKNMRSVNRKMKFRRMFGLA